MATYNPLKIQQQKLAAQQAELERLIAEQLAAERAAALKRARELISQYQISTMELEDKPKPNKRSPKISQAKYCDPTSGKKWTGRGRTPKWFNELLSQGKAPEDFRIKVGAKR